MTVKVTMMEMAQKVKVSRWKLRGGPPSTVVISHPIGWLGLPGTSYSYSIYIKFYYSPTMTRLVITYIAANIYCQFMLRISNANQRV